MIHGLPSSDIAGSSKTSDSRDVWKKAAKDDSFILKSPLSPKRRIYLRQQRYGKIDD